MGSSERICDKNNTHFNISEVESLFQDAELWNDAVQHRRKVIINNWDKEAAIENGVEELVISLINILIGQAAH